MQEKYSGNDFYCDIAIPKKQEIKVYYEDENVLAFYHTKPYWEIHIVVVPKKHLSSFTTVDFSSTEVLELIKKVQEIAREIETKFGKARILTNLGEYQDSKHLHFHVSSGEVLKK